MAQQVDELAVRKEHRTRSELVQDAIRAYIDAHRVPEEIPTTSELRAIRLGRAAYRRGEYTTLDALRTPDHVDRPHRRARTTVS